MVNYNEKSWIPGAAGYLTMFDDFPSELNLHFLRGFSSHAWWPEGNLYYPTISSYPSYIYIYIHYIYIYTYNKYYIHQICNYYIYIAYNPISLFHLDQLVTASHGLPVPLEGWRGQPAKRSSPGDQGIFLHSWWFSNFKRALNYSFCIKVSQIKPSQRK